MLSDIRYEKFPGIQARNIFCELQTTRNKVL